PGRFAAGSCSLGGLRDLESEGFGGVADFLPTLLDELVVDSLDVITFAALVLFEHKVVDGLVEFVISGGVDVAEDEAGLRRRGAGVGSLESHAVFLPGVGGGPWCGPSVVAMCVTVSGLVSWVKRAGRFSPALDGPEGPVLGVDLATASELVGTVDRLMPPEKERDLSAVGSVHKPHRGHG